MNIYPRKANPMLKKNTLTLGGTRLVIAVLILLLISPPLPAPILIEGLDIFKDS